MKTMKTMKKKKYVLAPTKAGLTRAVSTTNAASSSSPLWQGRFAVMKWLPH